MFHISLSKLGYDINYHKKSPKTHILSNFIIIFYLKPKNTYVWQYLKSPWFKSMVKQFYQWNSNPWSKPWFKPMAIYLSKAQFSLATSKPNYHWQYQKPNLRWYYLNPNFHWQHQSPILIGNIKSPTCVGTIKSPS